MPRIHFLTIPNIKRQPYHTKTGQFISIQIITCLFIEQTTAKVGEGTPNFAFFFAHVYFFPASGQAVVTGVVPSPTRFSPSIFIAHRVQQSHCSPIFHQVLLTYALALPARQFVRKKKSPRTYTSMHSGGLELAKLTYTRLEGNLIRHRGDRVSSPSGLSHSHE